MSTIIHERENNEDSERHLSENREKFESDGMFLYRLMKTGKRFTDQEVISKYGINGRRLRELFNEKSDVKKQWKLNDKGKRMYVEYFVPMPESPTKAKAIQWATEFLDKQLTQGSLL